MAAPSPLSLLPGRLNNERTWGGEHLRTSGSVWPWMASPLPASILTAPLPSASRKDGGREAGGGGGQTPSTLGVHTHLGAVCVHPLLLPARLLRTSGSCTLIPASGRHRSHARKRRGGSPAGGRGGPRRRAGVDPPLGLALLPAPPPPGGNCRAPCRGGGAEPIRQGSLRPAFPTPPPPAVRAASCAAPAGFGAATRGRVASLQFGAHVRRWESD